MLPSVPYHVLTVGPMPCSTAVRRILLPSSNDSDDSVRIGGDDLGRLRVERRSGRVVGDVPEHIDAGVGEHVLDHVGDAVAVGVVEVEDETGAMPSSWTRPGTAPCRRPAERHGSRGPCRRRSSVPAGVGRAEHRDAGGGDGVDDGQAHARGGGADDGVDALAEQAVDRLARGVGRGVARVAWEYSTGLPSTPPAVVDLVDRELDTSELGWSEERQQPVCGSSEPILSTPSPARLGRHRDVGRRSTTAGDWRSRSVFVVVIRLSAPNVRIAYEPSRGSPLPLKSSGPEMPS